MENNSLLIVVPTLDSFDILPKLVSSLQIQSCALWRVVFVDGPSCRQHRQWLNSCCTADSRFSWVEQDPDYPGIFGAMTQGFSLATPSEWLLFWGSDDWAPTSDVFERVLNSINSARPYPDLFICRGRYFLSSSNELGRASSFGLIGSMGSFAFRLSLWFGSSPPHQGTLFGPGSRSKLSQYDTKYRLSADLDYFLQLSSHHNLRVSSLPLELVHMSDAGISGQQTKLRLSEVRLAYRRAFGVLWPFPYLFRYLRRFISLLRL